MTDPVEIVCGDTLVATAPTLEAAAGAIVQMSREDRRDPAELEVRLRGDAAVLAAYVPPPLLRTRVPCIATADPDREVEVSTTGDGDVVLHPGCLGGRPPEACLCAGLALVAAAPTAETVLGLIRDLWHEVTYLADEDPRHRTVLRSACRMAREQIETAERRRRQVAEARRIAAQGWAERDAAALEAFGITDGGDR